MSLSKRLKNLWLLSEWKPNQGDKLEIGDRLTPLYKPIDTGFKYEGKPQAQIIKRKVGDPITEVIKQDGE